MVFAPLVFAPLVFVALAFVALAFVAVVVVVVVVVVLVVLALDFVALALGFVAVGFTVDVEVGAGLTGKVVEAGGAVAAGAGPCSNSYSVDRAATAGTGTGAPQTSGVLVSPFVGHGAVQGSDPEG